MKGFMEQSTLFQGGTFVGWNDVYGNELIRINRDGSIDCYAINILPSPASPDTASGLVIQSINSTGVTQTNNGVVVTGGIPVVQFSEQVIGSLAPPNLISETALTTLFQITFYYFPHDDSGSGTWTPSLNWTNPNGQDCNLDGNLGPATAGNHNDGQSYSIPVLALGGTNIIITGAYSGTPFPMDVALRIVAMP